MRYLVLLMVMVFGFSGIGCTAISKPSASITGAQLGKLTSDGVTVNLEVLVSNPNAVPIPLTKTDYALELAGVKVMDGSASPSGSIPANGSLPITLPISLKWDDILKARDGVVASRGDVPFALTGKLGVGGGIPFIGDQSVPLNYSGKLPLRDALKDPQALINSPAARELARKVLGLFF